MSSPQLTLIEASEDDAARIADIHMAAFGTNLMLLAQFPTPAIRDELRVTLREKAIDEIRDPQWAVLVVYDDAGTIISFAKWRRPIPESELDRYIEGPWKWPKGTRLDVLEEWTLKVEEAGGEIAGKYTILLRGAASILVNWGVEHGKHENVPVALESTKNAWPFYEKLGFRGEYLISMTLEDFGDGGASVLYEEMCFLFAPHM
ncbi:acyl-CoA N-acyltransferase [Penicillium verrucosum]|uniref:acyl-CoA N-acyltransferase n=1 Tax=Penicillium verrucosum TaxID=60171 RepID=UPI0025450718|nr:acyl-CoA N-acyltransferase [Penicillium verrucosum]KAJ5942085.1 acyl-CoA N-acyltransferase [Penicillium verrucosum]